MLPLPELVITKTTKAPVIDGIISPGEWEQAAAGTGFHSAALNGGTLARNQSVFWVTYDDQYLYVCFKNYRGPDFTLLNKHAREPDDVNVVFDDSNEIWFTPPGLPATTYQTLFNSYPAVFDVKKIPAIGYDSKGWSGHWEIASSETKDYWIVEARAPIRSFGVEKITDGASWRGLFTTDILGKKDGHFRRWGPWITSSFADISGHVPLHFRENSAVFQLFDVESIFTGQFAFPMAVVGPAKGTSRVTVTLRIGAGLDAAPGDLLQTKTVEVADGGREAFTMQGELAPLNLPKVNNIPQGYCEITAKTADNAVLQHHLFRFVIDGYRRTPPAEIKRTPYDTPFGVTAFHAPLDNKLVVCVDRYYMDNRAAFTDGRARLLDPATGKVAAECPIAPFMHDYSRFPLDVSALKLPVETEESWAKDRQTLQENAVIAEMNKVLKAKGEQELPVHELSGVKPAEYTLEVTLRGADGKEAARTSMPVKLMDYQFEWQNNGLGLSDKVIPPWTPMQWQHGVLSMWNKHYRLNGLGLADAIENSGATQLSGPMRLLLSMGGRTTEVQPSAPVVRKLTEARAELVGTGASGELECRVETRAEFDGFVLNRMTIIPKKPLPVDRLWLEVTMPKSEADCFLTTSGGGNSTYSFTPRKWDSRESASGSRSGSFVPYVFLTDSERGFAWFADNDQGYLVDPARPMLEVATEGDRVVLRVNFINQPGLFTQPTTVEYGWMVTPEKPQPSGWRAIQVANYTKPYPKARATMYADFDRRVNWDYYSAPYPLDMDKSRAEIQQWIHERPGITYCVGHTGDALGFFQDYKGRDFSPFSADWSVVPGSQGSGEVTRCNGANEYELWNWDRWMRLGGLQGIYFDINYLGEEWNYLSGTAYRLPDGKIQPGYSYLGQREYLKRLRYLFYQHGERQPNIWLHTTNCYMVYSWLGDVAMEGENVMPTGPDDDYIDALHPARMRGSTAAPTWAWCRGS